MHFQPFAHPAQEKMLHIAKSKNYEDLPQQTRRGRLCSSRWRVQLRESRCLLADRGPAEEKIVKDPKVNIARQFLVWKLVIYEVEVDKLKVTVK